MDMSKALAILYGVTPDPTPTDGVEAWQTLINEPDKLFHLPKFFQVTARQLIANGTCKESQAAA